MKPIQPVIPEMPELPVTVWAKDQPEYLPFPSVVGEINHEQRVITRWHLSWRERFRVLFGGSIWLTVLNFGKPLQPVLLESESPAKYLKSPGPPPPPPNIKVKRGA